MQIDLLNLLGAGAQVSPTAPTIGTAGEFDLVLAQTQLGGTSPPGVAPPPFLLGTVSANGTEEVSHIQPNAVASKLDFLPTDTEVKISESASPQNPSLDSLLAAMNLSFRAMEPVSVTSVPVTQAINVGNTSVVSITQSRPAMAPWDPARPRVETVANTTPLHAGAVPALIEATAATNGPTTEFKPTDFSVPSSIPAASPSVMIEGLSRQFGTKQTLDPEMVAQLGLQSMKAAPSRPVLNDLDSTTLEVFQSSRPTPATTTNADKIAKPTAEPTPIVQLSAPAAVASPTTEIATSRAVVADLVAPLTVNKNIPGKSALETATQAKLEIEIEIDNAVTQGSSPTLKDFSPKPDRLLGSDSKTTPAAIVTSTLSETAKPTFEDSETTQPIAESTAPAPVAMRELLATSRTEEVVKPAQLPERAQREVVQQTVDRIEAMAIQRPMSQVVIHLNPEHLGEIAIKVRVMGNRSEAEITATDERVVQALDGNRPQLVQAIESKGFSLSSLTMQFGGERGDQTPAQREDFARAMNSFQNAPTDGGEVATVSTYGSSHAGGLNLVI